MTIIIHRLFILVLLLISLQHLHANNNVSIINSNYNNLKILYNNEKISFKPIKIDDYNYFKPIEFKYLESNINQPFIISDKLNINIPTPDGFYYNFKVLETEIIENFDLAPTPKVEFSKNGSTEIYNLTNEYYNIAEDKILNIDYKGIAGNKYVAEITILPYIYNPIEKKLTIFKKLEIDINFSKNYYPNNSKDNFNYANAINFLETKNWGIKEFTAQNNNPSLLNNELKMSQISNGTWIKIDIPQTGIYKIDAKDIENLGYKISQNDIKTIKIFGIGGKNLSENVSDALDNNLKEQEIIVNTNADGSLSNIIFYASGPVMFEKVSNKIRRKINYYNNTIGYLLTWGGTDGKRAEAKDIPTGNVVNYPKYYTERFVFEEDLVNPYSPGAGRDWFGRSFFNIPFNPIMLHNLDRNGSIEYFFALAHHSFNLKANYQNFGTFKIYENNQYIGEVRLAPDSEYKSATRQFKEIKIPASSIASDNRSILKLEYSNPNDLSATPYFDYLEIHYPRSLVAINNTINLIPDLDLSGITQYNINGFTGQVYGFDITDDSNPHLIKNNSSTGGMFVLIDELKQNEFKNYFISSNLLKPNLSKTEVANLRDIEEPSQVVIITHKDLVESAVKYMDYRKSQGYSVSLFRTDHIYNEFAAGNQDVAAIRNFLSYLKIKWNGLPEYVVLWGDGHYDYRNIATKKVNYLPPYQTHKEFLEDYNEIHENYATDDFFAELIGNDNFADIKIGRITIDEPKMGYQVFEKIVNYENSQSNDLWRTNVLLVADDGNTNKQYEGTLHNSSSERLHSEVLDIFAPDLQVDKLYMVEYPFVQTIGGLRKPKVTDNLLTTINTKGIVLLNWFGHGNPRVWAHEFILERDITIPKMTNKDKLFFLTAATCDFGRFDDPEVRSGAEEMFISPDGGAIGVLSATRVVYASDNEALTKDFYRALFTKNKVTGEYPTLGEAMFSVKLSRISSNDRKYFLLGDPLVKLSLPENQIKIDYINGQSIDNLSEPIELKALSEVKIEGSITDRSGKNTLENFNGYVVITLRDGDKFISMNEVINNKEYSQFNFTKLGPALNQSTYKVENGKFIASFIIPKDISFSNQKAKLFTYAYTDNKQFAKGIYKNIMITGFDEISSIKDNEGPEINIFLDNRNFKDGDIVSEKPLLIVDLFDKSGINTTGLGIGHKIEAWINDSKISIDLTDKFVTSITDSRGGSVSTLLSSLNNGFNKIRVRAWDVFNNFSIKEVTFYVDKNSIYVSNLENYPNPFENSTTIKFRHNCTIPASASIDIYTLDGKRIRTLKNNINTIYESEIYWNGLDEYGNIIPNGVYIYKINIENNSQQNFKIGKLIKNK
jgi:hypothetical protein